MANVIITGHNNACGYEVGTCKQCGEMGLKSIFKYCPSCGALLDWEDEFSEDSVEYDTHIGLASLLSIEKYKIFTIAAGMSEELDSLDASVNCYYREGLKKAAEIIAERIGGKF